MPYTKEELQTYASSIKTPRFSPALIDEISTQQPDEVARNLQLSAKTGIPAASVSEYAGDIARSDIQKAYAAFATDAPKGHAWATKNPDNYSLIQDALPQSARLEALLQKQLKGKGIASSIGGQAVSQLAAIPRAGGMILRSPTTALPLLAAGAADTVAGLLKAVPTGNPITDFINKPLHIIGAAASPYTTSAVESHARDYAAATAAQDVSQLGIVKGTGLGLETLAAEAGAYWDKYTSDYVRGQQQNIAAASGLGKLNAIAENPAGFAVSALASIPASLASMGAGSSLARVAVNKAAIESTAREVGARAAEETRQKAFALAAEGKTGAEAAAAIAEAEKIVKATGTDKIAGALAEAAVRREARTAAATQGMIASEAATGGLVTLSSIQAQVESMPEAELIKVSPRYVTLLQSNSPATARAILAAEAWGRAALPSALATAAGSRITGGARASAEALTGNIRGVLKNLHREGGEEGTQSALEEVATLQGRRVVRADASVDLLGSALEGYLTGVAAAGPVQLAGRAGQQPDAGLTEEEAITRHAQRVLAGQAQDAQDTFSRLSDVVTAANEHPLRQRHPGKFNEYLTEVLPDSGLSEVYIDASALNEVLTQTGADLNLLETQMPDVVAQLQDGLSVEGSTVRIRTADLVTYVTDPAMQNALLPLLKRAPEGMNYGDSQVFFQAQTQELEKQATELADREAPAATREEYEAAQQSSATPAEIDQRTNARVAELTPLDASIITPEQSQELAFLATADAQARAQHFGVQLVQDKPAYSQYLNARKDKGAVRAAEVENLRRGVIEGMRAMNVYTESAIHAYATPLVELYQLNSARLDLLPSELMEMIPLRFLAQQMSGNNPQEGNKATVEDFASAGIADILHKSDWSILTAENPMKLELSAEENAKRNAAMRSDIEAAGYEVIPVKGVYDRPDENSFIVLGISEEDALAMGQKYEQDSVITRNGFIYSDGMYTVAQGVTVYDTAPEQYFTTLPDGTIFKIDMEMDADFNFVKRPRNEAMDPAATFSQNAQTSHDAAVREVPEGPLDARDLKDLRTMWERYTLSDGEVAQFGTSTAKAGDPTNAASAIANMQEIISAIYANIEPNYVPAVRDITRTMEGGLIPYGSYAMSLTTLEPLPNGKTKTRTADVMVDLSDKTIQLNVSQWGKGGRGSAIYKAVLDFSRNNGFVFLGDNQGISVAGSKRRLENLLSHAVQTQDTSYMRLHPKQLAFIEQETGVKIQWVNGAHEKNIEQMLNASYNLAIKFQPEIKNVYFDFTTRSFVDSRTGAAFTDFAGLAAKASRDIDALAREGAAGVATLKRTAIASSILRVRPEHRHLVFRALADFSVGLLPGAERLLYQQTGGAAKEGAVSVIGSHFSPQRRPILDGRKYGTGVRGAEARRVMSSADSRIRDRVHFYVDEGNGVFPEQGVGREEHIVKLHNLYDGARNPLRLPSESNAFEAAVIDAGFDGYYIEGAFGRQGAAVLLGEAARGVIPEGAVKQVRAAANNAVEENLDALVDKYLKLNDNVIDVDAARELFPEYAAGKDARTRFSEAVHAAASRVANAAYRRALLQDPAEGKLPVVLFTAGGGGSGKSSARVLLGGAYKQAQIVYDGTLSKYDTAKQRIQDALAAGKKVEIHFTLRDPLAAWVGGVLPRAMQDGRMVPLYAHAQAHRNAVVVLKQLAAEYKEHPRVHISVIENHGTLNDIKLGSLDSLASVNYNELEARLYEALDKEFQDGKITRQIYEAAKASSRGIQEINPQGVRELNPGAAQGVVGEPGTGSYFQSQSVDQPITKPAFYSVLTQQVEKHPQKKGSPQQWADVIGVMAKKGLVKPEEVEYTGVLDWLEEVKKNKPHARLYDAEGALVGESSNSEALPPEGGRRVVVDFSKSLSREDVVEYLRNNAVVINPVVRQGAAEDLNIQIGDWETEEPDGEFIRESAQYRFDEDKDAAREEYAATMGIELEEVDDRDVINELFEQELDYYWTDSESPRRATIDVTLPSGREIVLHAYEAYGEITLQDTSSGAQDANSEANDTYVEDFLRRQYPEEFVISAAPKWEKPDYILRGEYRDYQERLLVNESHIGDAFQYDTHFDEENIAAFTRSNTRDVPLDTLAVTHPELAQRLHAEGKTHAKVLFAEEIQSDWAQQGRDKIDIHEQVHYTKDMLTLLPSEADELTDATIVSYQKEDPGYEEGVVTRYKLLGKDGRVILKDYVTREAVEAEVRRIQSTTGLWRFSAPNGRTIVVNKNWHPTLEEAKQHVIDTQVFTRVKSVSNPFEIDAKRKALKQEIDAVLKERRAHVKENESEDDVFYALTEKAKALEDELEGLPQGITPSAFVTKTDSWVALVLKDLIRHAAENSFDLVAWTTGDQQTARWSGGLRHRVDTIEWVKSAEGLIHIKALKKGRVRADTRYAENDLTAAIGKTMAERIIANPNQSGTIEGDDIVVADLGMVKFYGDLDGNNPDGNPAIVSKVANNVLKKLGAGVKVRAANLSTKGHAARSNQQGNAISEEDLHYQPSFEITPQLKEMALQGLPLFQDKKLAFFNPDKMIIAMLQGANLSSMIHESGHFYLEALRVMSAHPKATQQMKDDFAKTLSWFGVPDRATWDAMTLEQKRPYHEQWAQSNERWVMEGKAPTVEMQPVFARFRAWMLSAYKSLEQFLRQNPLAGKLNDEMRGVFARLIAAEDAIKAAEAARSFVALTKPEGVSDAAYSAYLELGEEATQGAISDMQTRTLRDMKWLSGAKHKALRRLQREAAAKRKAIREEVTREVMAEPVNQARAFLTTGAVADANGDAVQVAVGHKIDTIALREMYPETMLARPDLTKLRGLTGAGVHPDAIAGVFGFTSGDALVRELIEAEPAKDKIEGLTDQRMLERHGELIDAESVERAAEAAIHNEARARFLATGLMMLTGSPAPAREMAKAAKEAAANAIARKKVRDLRPKQYSAAETRANKKALELAPSSPAEAADAQRAALLNNRLAAAATEALDDVEKALRLAEKFNSDGVRKNLDLEYLEQIDDLLNGFDFRKGQSLKAIDKRRSFAQFIELQEERGFEPIVSADQMEALSRKHYKDMTVEELRGLVDAIKHLEHLARLKKKLLTAKDEREFAQRIAEAVQSIEANANRTVEERATPSDVSGRAAQLWRGFAAEHRKVASIVREMDGGQDGGVMWDLLIRPMNEAGDNETEMRARAAEEMGEMFTPIKHKLGGLKGHLKAQRAVVPGTKISMSYEERVMFALNWGNEGNRQRLLDGGLTGKRSLAEGEAQAIIGTLDKNDWDFVQGVWDYFETFRPAVAAMERDITGKEPQWIDAAPVQTRFGVYRGGYFPAKYDAELSTRSESLEAAATLRMGMKGAFGAAGTRNSYTQKRAEQVINRPLLLSFNTISQHVAEVTHRLAWQRWVIDANRVLRALDGTVRDHYGPEILREMRKLVEDVASGDAPAANVAERVINHLRTGSTIVGMGWRFTTAMLQPSGLAQSWVRIGGKWVALGVKQYLAEPIKAAESVESRSKLMRDRNRTMQREINEIMNTVRVGDKLSDVQASYFWFIAKMQRTVDVPTWLGAYEKAVAQLGLEDAADAKARGVIEEKAIAMADQAVLDSQSGGQLKDLARVQRGSPIFKLFTNFYSYFSATYNLNVEAYRRTSFKDPAQVGAFAVDMLLLNTLPVLFSVALKELLKGGCDNADVACLLKQVGQEQVNYLFGQMILLREAGAAAGALTGDSFGYSGPAGLRFFSDLYKAGQQVGQGEADFAAWKAVTNTLAVPLHFPMGQVNTTLEGIIEMEKGNVEGFGILPALVAGKERKE